MIRKFKRVLTSRASYKKSKEYIFTRDDDNAKTGNEFTEKEFEELLVKAKNYNYNNPLMVNKETGIFVFYKDDLGVNIVHYHSFEKFREVVPEKWKNRRKNDKKLTDK